MNQETEVIARRSVLEQHAQTIIASILLALLLWAGNSLLDIRAEVITLKVQVATLEGVVRAGTDDRFRGTDWMREKQILDMRDAELKDRVGQLEKQVNAIERRLR